MDRAGKRDDVAAIFADRPHAAAAIDDLCAADADPHLRIAAESSEPRIFELDADGMLGRSVRAGMLVGLPLGLVLGATLVVIANWGGDTSMLRSIVAGAVPGLLAGLLFGGFAGMLRATWLQEDVDEWADLRLDGEQVLVVARAHGHAETVRRTLEGHGGRLIATHGG